MLVWFHSHRFGVSFSALRIEKLRRSGQLLLHSPDQIDAVSSNPVKEAVDTKSVPVATASIKSEELLLKVSEDVSRLAQIQTEADRNRRTSEAELLQKVQDMIATQKENDLQLQRRQSVELSSTAVLQLEQTKNEQMIQELKDMNAKILSEKESFMVQTSKLDIQLQQAQSQLTQLEQLNASLQNENVELRDIVSQLQVKVDGLEQAVQTLRAQLADSENHLQEMTHQNAVQTESFSDEILQLQQLNASLSSKYEQAVQSHEAIQATILLCQNTIQQYERDTIPNLEATIEMERDTIARLEERFHVQQDKETLQYQEVTRKLQEQLKQAQDMYEQEHSDLMHCQKECGDIQTQWNEYQACNERAVQDISEEIEQLKSLNGSLQSMNEKYLLQQKEINDALEESMMQNEQCEREKEALSLQYQQTMEQLRGMQDLIANKDTEISVQVKLLNDQLVAERQSSERLRIESDRTVQSQQQQITKLQQQVQQHIQERDEARSNMAGYNERENQLFQQLVHYENVRRSLHRKLIQYMGNIRVFVRIRPMLPSEHMVLAESSSHDRTASKTGAKRKRDPAQADGEEEIFRFPGMYDSSSADTEISETPLESSADLTKNIVEVVAPYKDRGGLKDRRTKWRFGFDHVFTPKQSQQDVWEATEPLVQCAVDGYNVTLFAYGQTGSGKTYTMLGDEGINEGIIGRTVRKLFDEKQKIIDLSRNKSHVSMFVELLEIYNEKVYDLMSSSREEIKVTSNEVVGNILVETKTAEDVLQILKLAQSRRCVKATNSNAVSSRSHLIFTIHFNVQIDDTKTRTGKINICDLAGSERLNKSGANLVGVRVTVSQSLVRGNRNAYFLTSSRILTDDFLMMLGRFTSGDEEYQ
jgi:kinesin family member C1